MSGYVFRVVLQAVGGWRTIMREGQNWWLAVDMKSLVSKNDFGELGRGLAVWCEDIRPSRWRTFLIAGRAKGAGFDEMNWQDQSILAKGHRIRGKSWDGRLRRDEEREENQHSRDESNDPCVLHYLDRLAKSPCSLQPALREQSSRCWWLAARESLFYSLAHETVGNHR